MQQRSKLPRCLPSCCLPHALQPLGHGCPLPSAVRAWPLDVLVGVDTRWTRLLPPDSPPTLPRPCSNRSSLLPPAPAARRRRRGACAFPAGCHVAAGAAELSRFSCGEFPDVHGFSRPRRVRPPLAVARQSIWPSPSIDRVGTPRDVFRGSIGARQCLCQRFARVLASAGA